MSASTSPPGKCSSPPNAIGSTNRLIASRYSGNIQLACRRWRWSTFSTTATWNWRGRNTMANIDSTIEPCPARISAAGPLGRREHRGELGVGGGAGEQIAEAAVDAEGDEQPHCKERDQLDHRLERDRRDHALVTLGRVQMARAEQDREGSQQQRDVESGVGQQRHFADVPRHGDLGVVREHGEAVRHRLELQRDVGDDADHCDHGDEPGEQRALAVARADEVRDRGDAVGLADRDDLAHDDDPQRGDQRGSQVDRQETDPARRRAPHASVERPRGRVDAERQRVDVRVGDQAAALVGAAVAVPGDAEQRGEVCDRYDADDPALEHAGARRGPGQRCERPLTSAMSTISPAQATNR